MTVSYKQEEGQNKNHTDLTIVDVKNEKPFSRTWRVYDIQLQLRCMFPNFSKISLVVHVRSGRDGIYGKIEIEVIDDIWQIQKL